MSARTKARKRALDILFGADVRGIPIADLLADESVRAASQPQRESSWLYAREIVAGVQEHLDEIDAAIVEHAQGWKLDRMPALDRALARLATWEILFNPEVPNPVAISEAVEAATIMSTDDSAGFLNGLLGGVARSQE
ncbi:transcription antitermination factor NusB [uncultured Schumannella sp.]|uniref:transcription antitermination factor NusB n=1 Tax=uncultured Schumannella sp. TaxID=1195956 RepID=UPI0025DE32B4|nr:transcription antitermination factor NusB [uncultured Schumannella sp.]